jgi:hypothetical protein
MGWHDIFQEICVLSLAYKQRRQEQLRVEFNRVGIDPSKVSWISAMNGKKPEIRELVKRLAILQEDFLPFFTPGHLGCLFSHYSLWLRLYTRYLNESLAEGWYLICEDDTKFLPSVDSNYLETLWNQKPGDAKCIKFHATYAYQPNPNLISQDYNTFFRKQTRISFSLMCYAVHTSFLPTLLFTKWKNHIDLFHAEGIYLVKTPPETQQGIQTLYSSEGFFTEGICLTNNDIDSDTAQGATSQTYQPALPVQQLFDSIPPQEGNHTIHIYDDFKDTGTCHVHFQYELKKCLEVSRENESSVSENKQ